MNSSIFRLLLLVALGSMGCADPTCKQGCDRARACGLSTSGLSCSESVGTCTSPDNGCAACLEDTACDQIRSGACASACPGYRP